MVCRQCRGQPRLLELLPGVFWTFGGAAMWQRHHMQCLLLVIAIHVVLLAGIAIKMSPTLDEPANLAAGISHLAHGTFSTYSVNGPLPRVVAAAPVMLVGIESDWTLSSNASYRSEDRIEFSFGDSLMRRNGRRFFTLLTLARLATIPFSVLGAVICFRWGRDLSGSGAGLLAACLWCFSPEVLAHGSLVTPTTAAASFGCLACYTFWRWLNRPSSRSALVAGISFGSALLTKSTWIILYGVWPVLLVVWLSHSRKSAPVLRLFWQMLLQLFVATLVLNLGYLCRGTLRPLESYQFKSHLLANPNRKVNVPASADMISGNRFHGTWLGLMPVPFPSDFIDGIDLQKRDFETLRWMYLDGVHSFYGWPSYYLWVCLYKLPLGILLLLCLSLSGLWMRRRQLRDELCLLLPAATVFAVASMNYHFACIRYLFPAYPLMMIFCTRMMALERSKRLWDMLSWSLAIAVALSSMAAYPYELSYCNEYAGGVYSGDRHVIGADYDCGQDAFYLEEWRRMNRESRPLYVLFNGLDLPRTLEIDFETPKRVSVQPGDAQRSIPLEAGWYAVSIHFVRGGWGLLFDHDGRLRYVPVGTFPEFEQMTPVTRLGSTILIYHVSPASDFHTSDQPR